MDIGQIYALDFVKCMLAAKGSFRQKDLTDFLGLSRRNSENLIQNATKVIKTLKRDGNRYVAKADDPVLKDINGKDALRVLIMRETLSNETKSPLKVCYTNNYEQIAIDLIRSINEAMESNHSVEITYFGREYDNHISVRRIEPKSFCYINDSWHIIAHCRDRNAERNFILDRILNWRVVQSKQKSDEVIESNENIKLVFKIKEDLPKFDQDFLKQKFSMEEETCEITMSILELYYFKEKFYNHKPLIEIISEEKAG